MTTIEGGPGNDELDGAPGDVTIEATNAGFDKAFSSVSFDIAGESIEELELPGLGNNKASGNTLANRLVGNSGNNVFKSRSGDDTPTGGIDTITDFNTSDDTIQLDPEHLHRHHHARYPRRRGLPPRRRGARRERSHQLRYRDRQSALR